MISNNVVCATSKASDQPAHTRSLIGVFACRLEISRRGLFITEELLASSCRKVSVSLQAQLPSHLSRDMSFQTM